MPAVERDGGIKKTHITNNVVFCVWANGKGTWSNIKWNAHCLGEN